LVQILYIKAALKLMSILHATHSYSVTQSFFKIFRTRSQQIKLKS